MERTIEYIKNLKEDITHSIAREDSLIQVNSNDLQHINEALEDVRSLQQELERFKDFVIACRNVDIYELPQLRREANNLLKKMND